MINIFRLLNIKRKHQKKMLLYDRYRVIKKCKVISERECLDQKEEQEFYDNNCPKCNAPKDKIVDKICDVNGKGNIGGDITFGFGEIDGNINIETNSVNHCNVCGNEWKKFKFKYVSDLDILRLALKYLSELYENPENDKYEWKKEIVEVFNDCYLETILNFKKEFKHSLNSNTYKFLNKKYIIKTHISIFNK